MCSTFSIQARTRRQVQVHSRLQVEGGWQMCDPGAPQASDPASRPPCNCCDSITQFTNHPHTPFLCAPSMLLSASFGSRTMFVSQNPDGCWARTGARSAIAGHICLGCGGSGSGSGSQAVHLCVRRAAGSAAAAAVKCITSVDDIQHSQPSVYVACTSGLPYAVPGAGCSTEGEAGAAVVTAHPVAEFRSGT
jgi:hypothetical protein